MMTEDNFGGNQVSIVDLSIMGGGGRELFVMHFIMY